MIHVNRIFNPVKLLLQDPQDVLDLCRAIEDSIHKLDNRFWGLADKEVSTTHKEYYYRMQSLLKTLRSVPTQKEFTI